VYHYSHCVNFRSNLQFTGQDKQSFTLSPVEHNTDIHYIFTELNNGNTYLDTRNVNNDTHSQKV
jgi:hypothetical protein